MIITLRQLPNCQPNRLLHVLSIPLGQLNNPVPIPKALGNNIKRLIVDDIDRTLHPSLSDEEVKTLSTNVSRTCIAYNPIWAIRKTRLFSVNPRLLAILRGIEYVLPRHHNYLQLTKDYATQKLRIEAISKGLPSECETDGFSFARR